jgi:hypothetical protein
VKFVDTHVSSKDFFSLGIEQNSGRYYLSIPVSSGLVDYEEYYEIPKDLVDRYPEDIMELRQLANLCRRRLNDNHLMVKPGTNRGSSNPIDYP